MAQLAVLELGAGAMVQGIIKGLAFFNNHTDCRRRLILSRVSILILRLLEPLTKLLSRRNHPIRPRRSHEGNHLPREILIALIELDPRVHQLTFPKRSQVILAQGILVRFKKRIFARKRSPISNILLNPSYQIRVNRSFGVCREPGPVSRKHLGKGYLAV